MQVLIASLILISALSTVYGEPMRLPRQDNVVNLPSTGENTALKVPQVNGQNSQWLAPVSAGPLDFQNLMEMFNSFTRMLLAPLSAISNGNGNGYGNGGNPSNVQLPTLNNLFAMPNDFMSKLLPGLYPPRQLRRDAREEIQRLSTSEPIPSNSKAPNAPKGLCIANLEKEFKENDAYFTEIQKQVDNTNIAGTYDELLKKAGEVCTPEQVNRLDTLLKKYDNLKKNVQELAPGYPIEVRHEVLNWMRKGDLMKLITFLGREGMASVFDQPKANRLMQTSFDLTAMQIELFFNPI